MAKFVFVDWEGERFELTEDEVEDTRTIKEFYHPLSGHRVYDWESRIVEVDNG